MSSMADFRDPRLNRTNSTNSETDKKQLTSPSRVDPRLRAQDHQQQPPQSWLPHMAQMPQTHYTIGDGLTTYQHLVPNAAAMYPTAAVAAPATYQYPGYAAATAYPSTAYAHPAYAAYYAPAPPPPPPQQRIEQHAAPYQQPPTLTAQAQVAHVQAQTYTPQGAPQGSWAPARMSEQVSLHMQAPISAYVQQQQAVSSGTALPPSPDITSTSKQEGVEQEMQQTQAEMRRQRDDYERRAAALNHELDQLKRQKREMKETGGSDRQTASILKDNGKLQVEIQSKLKEYVNVVDILTGILGDCKKGGRRSTKEHRDQQQQQQQHRSRQSHSNSRSKDNKPPTKSADGGESTTSSTSSSTTSSSHSERQPSQLPDLSATIQYNYVHYDPEVHWCRICDAFPRTAKDLLQHLHDDQHRQVMQTENIEIPWHKLPTQNREFPHREGATRRRVPIKGLQFFVSAPAWYCRLCDAWIGDLHCASQHLKSIGHSQNYANFVDQNPQWEAEWLEDRKKALERVSKSLVKEDKVLELVGIEKKLASVSSVHLVDGRKRDKTSKKSKKRSKKKAKKAAKKQSKDSDDSSSQSSSSSSDDEDTSSENDDEDDDGLDKSKSIRVTMRNQNTKSSSSTTTTTTAMDEQILILENLVKEKKRLQQQELQLTKPADANVADDRLISQWMNVDVDKSGAAGEKDKYLLDSLKDRLRQKHEAEQRARLLQQQQQQQQIIGEETKRQQREQERDQMEKSARREPSAQNVNSGQREQVKFRQQRGGKSATHRQQSSASPPPNNDSNNRYLKSRSRSSSAERRQSMNQLGSDTRDRRQRERNGATDRKSRSRSRSRSNNSGANQPKSDAPPQPDADRKSTAPKKLPFIGRMPLFRNRKLSEEHTVRGRVPPAGVDIASAVCSADYEMPRQSRFQPGNLARAFIPQPDVVHYPKLTTQPAPVAAVAVLPEPPRISAPPPPPPPKIQQQRPVAEPPQFYDEQQVYEYTDAEFAPDVHHSDELPPPPPPPLLLHFANEAVPHDHDDLALLGISSDDMAAQIF